MKASAAPVESNFGSYPDERSKNCNNDLVLQGIVNLQKDISEIKTDIKDINSNVSDASGDIKVINNRLDTLDKTLVSNNADIKTINYKIHLVYGGLIVLAFVVPYVSNFLNQ